MLIKKFFKILLKKILKTKVVIACLSFVIYMYSKFVGATCKWQTIDFEKANDVVKDCNAIWVGWHSRATMMPYFWRRFFNRRMAALTSPHQDGQIIAKFLRWYGIDAVSGSTNEKARQGALEMLRNLVDGADLFVSPDGPRGPRQRMKKSPIYFAQKTGKPIVCICFSLDKAKIIEKAWDKTMIALPFGKGVLGFSEPLFVPENLSDEEFEELRQKLEDIANELSFRCDKAVGREAVLPADINDFKQKKE